MQREFNLIDESWICVRTDKCMIKQVSLKELFFNAHHYLEFAGESKPQDFAILRLCLALMHTIFSRYDVEGKDIAIDKPNTMLNSWKLMWEQKNFPKEPINRYFDKWHDKFWLFDDTNPFYQSIALKEKKEELKKIKEQNKTTKNTKTKNDEDIKEDDIINNSKLIGTIFQSNNKIRMFADRKEEGINLSYAEAARWLLHLNCFDDTAAKIPGTRKVPKRAYVGQLGLIAIKGKNLFETLLLNFTVKEDKDKSKIRSQNPYWEKENKNSNFNNLIAIPNNQAELLSLQSRRIYLIRKNKKVIGYYVSGGDYFEEEDIYIEQMTLWTYGSPKKQSSPHFMPKKHSPLKKVWQEFGSIAAFSDSTENRTDIGKRVPGVISWIQWLFTHNFIHENYSLNISTTAIIYDTSQATSLPVKDLISDSLTFHYYLILKDYEKYRTLIYEEINKCEKVAKEINELSSNLQIASGAYKDKSKDDKNKDKSKDTDEDAKEKENYKLFLNKDIERLYGKFDLPFRLWLRSLGEKGISESEISNSKSNIESTLKRISLNFANELVTSISDTSIFGRYKLNKIYSSAQALYKCRSKIYQIFNKAGENNG